MNIKSITWLAVAAITVARTEANKAAFKRSLNNLRIICKHYGLTADDLQNASN